jgi:putative PIN family toxin of toxin-antitoxin system
LRIVLDTNIFLVSLPSKSPFRPIFDAFLDKKFDLIVSTDILLEYEEVLGLKANGFVAKNAMELLNAATNVEKTEVFYRWNLISQDPDDNKFVDCAIAGKAHFIVTHDSHFNVLHQIGFPKVEIMTANDFLAFLKS